MATVRTGDVPRQERPQGEETGPLQALLNRAAATRIGVGRQPSSVYDELTGNRIRTTAGKLGLPHLAETINEFTRRADEAKMGYLDFLDMVLSEGMAVRDDRWFRQGLRLSRLPHHKRLDEYDFLFQPDLNPRKVKGLATLSFVEAKAKAAPLGPPEVGKTHIALALAVAACQAGYSVYFISLDDMDGNLKAAEAAGRLTNKLGTHLRPGVLVVDEEGYEIIERGEANSCLRGLTASRFRTRQSHHELCH